MPIRPELSFYLEKFPEESSKVRAFDAFFNEHASLAFARENLTGHATASGLVFNPSLTHVALVHHKKLNLWLPPGGHADGCEDLCRVALQELWEETGLKEYELISLWPGVFDLDSHIIPAHGETPSHMHYDFSFLFYTHQTELVLSHESTALGWFPIEEVFPLGDASLNRKLRKFLNIGFEI